MTESGYIDAGKLSIGVEVDTRGFSEKLRRAVAAESAGVTADVGLNVEASTFRDKLRAEVEAAQAGVSPVDIPTTGPDPATRENTDDLDASLKALRRDVDAASVSSIRLQQAQLRLAKTERSGSRDTVAYRKALLDVTRAEQARATAVAKSRSALDTVREQFARTPTTIDVHTDVAAAEAEIDVVARDRIADIHAEVDKTSLGNSEKTLNGFASRVSNRLAGFFSGLFKPTLFTGLVSFAVPAIESLGSGLVALAATAAHATGVLATLPAIGASAALTLGTVVIAATGLGDAFKALASGDAKKFGDAMRKLTPAARQLVYQIALLKPLFSDVRRAAQENLLKGVGGDLAAVARRYLPVLKNAVSATAVNINTSLRSAFDVLRRPAFLTDFSRSLAQVSTASAPFSKILVPTLRIANNLFAAGAPYVRRFADYLLSAVTSFDAFVDSSRRSGALAQFLADAVRLSTQWGRILRNVTVGLFGIFRAGDSQGQALLTTLEKITKKFADFTNSTQGQQKINNFFQAMGNVLRGLGQIITDVASSVARLQSAFNSLPAGVQESITKFGALAVVLSPLTGVLSALAGSVGGVAETLAAIASSAAAAPLAAIAATAALAAGAFGALYVSSKKFRDLVAEAFTTTKDVVSDMWKQVKPILRDFRDIFETAIVPAVRKVGDTIADKLKPAVREFKKSYDSELKPALADLAKTIHENEPEIKKVIGWLGDIADGFAKITLNAGTLKNLVKGFFKGLAFDVHAVSFAVDSFSESIDGLSRIGSFLSTLWSGIKTGAGAAGSALADAGKNVGRFFSDLGSRIGSAAKSLGSTVGGFFSDLWKGTTNGLSSAGSTIVGFFTDLPAKIGSGLAAGGRGLGEFFSTLLGGLKKTASVSVGDIASFFAELPFRILSGLLNGFAAALTFWTSVFNTLTSTAGRALDATVGFFRALPGRIGAVLSSLGSTVGSVFSAAWTWVRTVTVSYIESIIATFRAFPGRARSAISTLGSALGSAIAAAWTWVRTVTAAYIESTLASYRAFPGRARAAISALGSALGSAIAAAWGVARAAVARGISSVASFFGQLPSRIRSAIGDIGSRMETIGAQIIDGIVRGVRSGISRVGKAMSNVANAIPGPVKKLLHIGSPSKLMIKYGQWTVEGLTKGMASQLGQVRSTASAMATAVAAGAPTPWAYPIPSVASAYSPYPAPARAGTGGNTTIHIHPAPGMSISDLAEKVSRELEWVR